MRINLSELIGKRFSYLTVVDAYRDNNNRVKCICKCDCGEQADVFYSNLKSGKTQSCGHLERENRRKYADMVGQQFGDLTVLERTDERQEGCIVWLCQCSCGELVRISRRRLVKGYATKCPYHKKKELIGKTFAHLTIKNFDKNSDLLLCECDCGKRKWIDRNNILNGHTKSCGHLTQQDRLPRVDGVVTSALRRKKSISNTSGIVGVSETKSGKFISYITFKNKRHTLGLFEDIEDAKAEREWATQKYFQPYLLKEKNLKQNTSKAVNHSKGLPIEIVAMNRVEDL